MSIPESLAAEIDRVTEVLRLYKAPPGMQPLGRLYIGWDLKKAKAAAESGDEDEMTKAIMSLERYRA